MYVNYQIDNHCDLLIEDFVKLNLDAFRNYTTNMSVDSCVVRDDVTDYCN